MDDLDRLYRRLVQNIRATRPEYLQIPFTVQELYEQIIPYRHNRRELGIDNNQDYESAIARLLSGERNYVRTDATLRDAILAELQSPTGDPGIFKEHSHVQLTLLPVTSGTTPLAAPATSSALVQKPADESPRASEAKEVEAAFDTLAPTTIVPSASPVPSLLSSLTPVDIPSGCRFCGGTLPDDRDVNYCPHCGENLKTKRCPACGSEMDTAWRFCVTCGRRA